MMRRIRAILYAWARRRQAQERKRELDKQRKR